jgi:hypothetical protein
MTIFALGERKIEPFEKFPEIRVNRIGIFYKIQIEAFDISGGRIGDILEIFHNGGFVGGTNIGENLLLQDAIITHLTAGDSRAHSQLLAAISVAPCKRSGGRGRDRTGHCFVLAKNLEFTMHRPTFAVQNSGIHGKS